MQAKIVYKVLGVMLMLAAIAGLIALFLPWYQEQAQARKLAKLTPTLNLLLAETVNYTNTHGVFPDPQQFDFNTIAVTTTKPGTAPLLYSLKFWASDPAPHASIKQTAYLQAYLNGRAIGLAPGTGGMVTCLLAHKSSTVETACYYQVKDM